MRIVVLGTRGFPDVQGGIERHCENLYPRLVNLGCEVIVLARAPYTGCKEYSFRGVTIKPISCPRRKSLEAITHTLKGLIEAKGLRPDILHIHAIGPALTAPLAKLLGFNVVMTHHGQDYKRLKWGMSAKAALRLGEAAGCVFSNAVIAVSDGIASECARKFRRAAAAIPNGVNLPRAALTDGIQRKLGIEKGRYFLAVGRFVPEKGFLDLIEAFGTVSKSLSSGNSAIKWKLVIAGGADHDDAYSRAVKEKAKAAKDVVLAGYQGGLPLAELYSHAGLFVLPSYHEGLPIALLEAMSYGLPCVVSDIAANREVALARDRYFECGDTDKLAGKMLEFMVVPFTEEEKMAQAGLIAKKYDWDTIARETMKIYKSLERTAAGAYLPKI